MLNKRSVVFFLALSVVAVAVLPLMFTAYMEFYVKPYVQSKPEWMRAYVNYEPFLGTVYGLATIAVWVFIGDITLLAYLRRLKKERVLVAVLLALLFIAGFSGIGAVEARCNTWNFVDVLCLGDEEFMARSDWVEKVEVFLSRVNEERFTDSKIMFFIRGWLEWDSDDSCTVIYELMQEAIVESGMPRREVEVLPGLRAWAFISGSEWVDSDGVVWWIDELLIFTGQGCDMKALGPEPLNVAIFRWDGVDFRIMTHEFGHEYCLPHCGDAWCVMNVDWQFGDNFCANCRAKLDMSRDKWMTDPEIFFGLYLGPRLGEEYWKKEPGSFTLSYEGKTVTVPNAKTFWGWGNMMRFRCLTIVKVQIRPSVGFGFNYCYVGNHQPIFTQDPGAPSPPSLVFYTATFSFCLNDTWTFAAFLYYDPCSSSGGRFSLAY